MGNGKKEEKYENERKKFVAEFGHYDNNGSKIVSNRIHEVVTGGE